MTSLTSLIHDVSYRELLPLVAVVAFFFFLWRNEIVYRLCRRFNREWIEVLRKDTTGTKDFEEKLRSLHIFMTEAEQVKGRWSYVKLVFDVRKWTYEDLFPRAAENSKKAASL